MEGVLMNDLFMKINYHIKELNTLINKHWKRWILYEDEIILVMN